MPGGGEAQRGADNYLAKRKAAINAQAATDTAKASATYTTATAVVRATLSATVNSAKATYTRSCGAGECDAGDGPVERRFDRGDGVDNRQSGTTRHV